MRPTRLPRPLVRSLLTGFYRITFDPRMPVAAQRRILDVAARAQPMPNGTVVRSVALGGRPAERITVGATERPRAVLYLHGGGYVVGSLGTHRSLAAFLARDSSSAVFSLDYRLAPEHRYPAAVDDAVAAVVALRDEYGLSADRIAIAATPPAAASQSPRPGG